MTASNAAEPLSALPIPEPFKKLSALISEYVRGYELRDAEDENGNTGDYTPNERELMLIEDAINGLIADEDFEELQAACRALTWARRQSESSCPRCGCPNGQGHYNSCLALGQYPPTNTEGAA